MAAAVVIAHHLARGSVATFENQRLRHATQRDSARDSRLLTLEERADVLLEWGGYESALSSTRSAFAAVLEAARRRAPPRERPVWNLVTEELNRYGRRMVADDLVVLIAQKEELASAHEVRLAIRGMIGAGRLTQYVQDMPRKREWIDPDGKAHQETFMAACEMVRLETPPRWRCPDPMTPEERWAKADEELKQYCRGEVPCHETQSRKPFSADTVGINDLSTAPHSRGLAARHRAILEAYYGLNQRAHYRDLFGDMAVVVQHTEAVDTERKRMDRGRRIRSTAREVLREILDNRPDDPAAAVRWVEARKAFIERVKHQARRALEDACEAYRLARRGV